MCFSRDGKPGEPGPADGHCRSVASGHTSCGCAARPDGSGRISHSWPYTARTGETSWSTSDGTARPEHNPGDCPTCGPAVTSGYPDGTLSSRAACASHRGTLSGRAVGRHTDLQLYSSCTHGQRAICSYSGCEQGVSYLPCLHTGYTTSGYTTSGYT
jgi:hypothetical protein